MTVTIRLPKDVEDRLRAKAARGGQGLEQYVLDLIERDAAGAPEEPAPTNPRGTLVAEWRAWAASRPWRELSMDDGRESIYEGRGE